MCCAAMNRIISCFRLCGDAMQGLIDAGRLADTLQELNGHIGLPGAGYDIAHGGAPIMQISRENTVRSEVGDDLMADMEQEIIRAANVRSDPLNLLARQCSSIPPGRCSGVVPVR